MQELYQQYKGLLFTLAYQLTGSTADAEDAVQDVFLKAYDVSPERLAQPKAYLCKMVTNRCLDLLKSARKRREQYVGTWLPEPILTPHDEPLESVVRGELLSYAMLVLLEKLTPMERAVFVLREALCFEYSDISDLVQKSEANCRKLYSRAKGKLGMTSEDVILSEAAGVKWVHRFLTTLEQGDTNGLVSLLAEDVVLLSDGGGKVVAAVHPIESRDRAARFLLGLVSKSPQFEGGVDVELKAINGQTGIVLRSAEGIVAVVLMHVEGHSIRNLYFVRNPDKLKFSSSQTE